MEGATSSNSPTSLVNCSSDYAPGIMTLYLYDWLTYCHDVDLVSAIMTESMFYSSETLLNPDADYGEFSEDGGDGIYNSPGTVIQKFDINLTAMILISVLILLQLSGLMALALYASS